jgi:phosphoribosylformylglycinamidine synthase
LLHLPIAHGEGNYVADEETLSALARERRIILRYSDKNGAANDVANPNGSTGNIAAICNAARNVFGMMPHPERACDPRLGSTDGRVIFESVLNALRARRAA